MTAPILPVRENPLAASDRRPLVVDLDGSLVCTDTLVETVLAAMRRPLLLLRAVAELRRGKARCKQAIAALGTLDPARLPYNRELLAFLRAEHRGGRRLVLATGADRRVALAVARHLQLFDAVLASDGETNLTGVAKLAAIRDALDGGPFTYIGNDRADLAVWRGAASGITVNPRRAVARKAALVTRIERNFSSAQPGRLARLE